MGRPQSRAFGGDVQICITTFGSAYLPPPFPLASSFNSRTPHESRGPVSSSIVPDLTHTLGGFTLRLLPSFNGKLAGHANDGSASASPRSMTHWLPFYDGLQINSIGPILVDGGRCGATESNHPVDLDCEPQCS